MYGGLALACLRLRALRASNFREKALSEVIGRLLQFEIRTPQRLIRTPPPQN
jgi:hypothetical protein